MGATFTDAITGKFVAGNRRFHFGTYVSAGGGTGGDIDTGLLICQGIFLQPSGAAVGTNQTVYNETLPTRADITIVSDADQSGTWLAFGR